MELGIILGIISVIGIQFFTLTYQCELNITELIKKSPDPEL